MEKICGGGIVFGWNGVLSIRVYLNPLSLYPLWDGEDIIEPVIWPKHGSSGYKLFILSHRGTICWYINLCREFTCRKNREGTKSFIVKPSQEKKTNYD